MLPHDEEGADALHALPQCIIADADPFMAGAERAPNHVQGDHREVDADSRVSLITDAGRRVNAALGGAIHRPTNQPTDTWRRGQGARWSS